MARRSRTRKTQMKMRKTWMKIKKILKKIRKVKQKTSYWPSWELKWIAVFFIFDTSLAHPSREIIRCR